LNSFINPNFADVLRKQTKEKLKSSIKFAINEEQEKRNKELQLIPLNEINSHLPNISDYPKLNIIKIDSQIPTTFGTS
jgi:hypothetical protein